MISRTVPRIKRAQKESSILRVVAPFVYQMVQEHSNLMGLSCTRVQLSRNKSLANVYLYITGGLNAYARALKTIVLYKPALRKALADSVSGRYVCEIRFTYDKEFERVEHIGSLIDRATAREQAANTPDHDASPTGTPHDDE